MKLILFLLAITLISTASLGQSQLEIFSHSGRAFVKPEYRSIKVWVADTISYSGKFSILSDEYLQLNDIKINVEDITTIRTSNPRRRIFGFLLLASGSYLTVDSLIKLNRGGIFPEAYAIPLTIGATALAFGVKLSIGKRYSKPNWHYELQ